MTSWLDTQTKAILDQTPPNKLAPPDTKSYSLVLISVFRHQPERLSRAIRRIYPDSWEQAQVRLSHPMPVVLRHQMTMSDALMGQFELICADAISVFIPDSVIELASSDYLTNTYNALLQSNEFEETSIVVDSIPRDAQGSEFMDQFFGSSDDLFSTLVVPFKKARIMLHWAGKIGAKVRLIAN